MPPTSPDRTLVRSLLTLVLVGLTLAFAPAALAETGPLPQVVPLAPADGVAVAMSGKAKDAPTLSWRINFPATLPSPTVMVHVLSDSTFTSGGGWTYTPTCDASTLSCTGTVKMNGSWFLDADTCRHSPQPAHCATRPKGYVDFWWRVSVAWPGHGYVYSQPLRIRALVPTDRDGDGIWDTDDNCPAVRNPSQADSDPRTHKGDACEPDRSRPRVSVQPATVRRGMQARIGFRMADNRGYVRVQVTVSGHGRTIVRGSRAFNGVIWSDLYHFRFMLFPTVPPGVYRACLRVTDRSGNAARSCAPLTVR